MADSVTGFLMGLMSLASGPVPVWPERGRAGRKNPTRRAPAATTAAAVMQPHHKAVTLAYAGDAHRDGGDLAAARQNWEQALAILDDLHHPDADTIRARLAHVPPP